MDFRQELKALDYKRFLVKSDWLAWRSLIVNYLLIAFAFYLPVVWYHPVSIAISLVLLGNRQLGLGILMHDCVHGALFKTRTLNKYCGEFLCAAPVLAQFEGYRRYHLKHHAKAGTTEDPDYPNYKIYPVTKISLYRKVARDLFGITGLKNLYVLMLMHAGSLEYDMAHQSHSIESKRTFFEVTRNLVRNLGLAVVFHGIVIGCLLLLNQIWVYSLWWVAYFTTFMLFSRIRNAAEHANVPDLLDADPRLHARTVYARWWERLTVAPNEVNYHLEHHWQPAIPPYQLAAFHRFLIDNGLLRNTAIFSGYHRVLASLLGK